MSTLIIIHKNFVHLLIWKKVLTSLLKHPQKLSVTKKLSDLAIYFVKKADKKQNIDVAALGKCRLGVRVGCGFWERPKVYILVRERTAPPCVFQTFAHPTSPSKCTGILLNSHAKIAPLLKKIKNIAIPTKSKHVLLPLKKIRLFTNYVWKGESSRSARFANGLQTTTPTAELTSGSC